MSRTVKLGLAAALVVIVVVVLAWASVASLAGGGPSGAATAFFKAIGDKGAQAAYAMTSPTFQRATPADAFVSTMQARGLSDYRSSDWTVRSRQGDLAELTGAVNLKGGGAVPADVRLVKGAAGWQVLSLDLPQGGLTGGSASASAANALGGEYDSANPTAPPPPPQPGAPAPAGPAGLVGGAQTPAPGYPAAPTGAPDGSAYGAGGAPQGGPELSRSRVARICGQTLMHNSWAESVRLHCPDPIAATPGATTRCLAMVNGRRTGMTATMDHYDPSSDDAQLTCRLD